MLKNCYKPFGVILLLFLMFSCTDDNENTEPVLVNAEPDTSEVFQGAFVDINLLVNDENFLNGGALTLGQSSNAILTVIDNNTPNNPTDDLVRYTPNSDFYGMDSFEYTICNETENCSSAIVTINVLPVSIVNFNLEAMPYDTLSEYNFFSGDMANLEPTYGVLPYDLLTPLFSDYASKQRFIWMPAGNKATYINDYSILDFPVGTILIKNFYYNNVLPLGNKRILETRLQIKKESGWVFAGYNWNSDQTEATFSLSGSFIPLDFEIDGIVRNVNYATPAASQCLTCHKSGDDVPFPIGMKPQSLNKMYTYEDGAMNQLQKFESFGYLESGYPSEIVSQVSWDDPSEPLELRVRSYLDINCAHCHSEWGHCNYRPVRFAFKKTGEDIANAGVCVDAHEVFDESLTKIIEPGNIERSILAYRIDTVEESLRMPLQGRTLRHDEGVALIEDWISSLSINCE